MVYWLTTISTGFLTVGERINTVKGIDLDSVFQLFNVIILPFSLPTHQPLLILRRAAVIPGHLFSFLYISCGKKGYPELSLKKERPEWF